jgi:hypothetical protein
MFRRCGCILSMMRQDDVGFEPRHWDLVRSSSSILINGGDVDQAWFPNLPWPVLEEDHHFQKPPGKSQADPGQKRL